MAQHVIGTKRRPDKKVWKLSVVVVLVAVSFNLAFAESTVRFVPGPGEETTQQIRSVQNSTSGAAADSATGSAAKGTEIRIISPTGQSTVSVRTAAVATEESRTAKSTPTAEANTERTGGTNANRATVGTVVIRSVTPGQPDLYPRLSSAATATASNELMRNSAPAANQPIAATPSHGPDLFERLFAITAKESPAPVSSAAAPHSLKAPTSAVVVAPKTADTVRDAPGAVPQSQRTDLFAQLVPADKVPAKPSADAEDLAPGLRLTHPQNVANHKPTAVVARTEPAMAPKAAPTRQSIEAAAPAIVATRPNTPSPANETVAATARPEIKSTAQTAPKSALPNSEALTAKSVRPDLFGPLHNEAATASARPAVPVAAVPTKPAVSAPVATKESPATPATPLAKAEIKREASVLSQQPVNTDSPVVAKQERPSAPLAQSPPPAATPSTLKDVNAMPLPAVSKQVASAPVIQPPRVASPQPTKAKLAETKVAASPPAEPKPTQIVVIPATPKALENQIAANRPAVPNVPTIRDEPVSAPPVVAQLPAPTAVVAGPVVAPAAPAAEPQVAKPTTVASSMPPANDDWKAGLLEPQTSDERVAAASEITYRAEAKYAGLSSTCQPNYDTNYGSQRGDGDVAYGDMQNPLATLTQESSPPARTDYAMLQLKTPTTASHGTMMEPMPATNGAPESGPMPIAVDEPHCSPTGCPYLPGQSGAPNICGVDCNHCNAPCTQTWNDSRCIPWSLFGPGEYVGPARTEHVSTYYLRVNDVIMLTFITSRRKETEHYRIGCGDRLQLEWLRSPSDTDRSLDREILVQPDGTVVLPLVGEINAAGKTVEDLRDELVKAYSKYQKDPQITVTPIEVNLALRDVINAVTGISGSNGQSQTLRVTPEGTIQAPGLGSIFVQGLTLDELRTELEARYATTFGPGLLVSPSLTQRSPLYVFVGGEVKTPARYPLEGPTTVMQAITLAGGWNIGGNLHQVVVFRRDENWCLKATKIDIRAPLYGYDPCPANDIWLRDNDLVVVPKSRILCATDVIQLYFTRGIYAVFPISYVYDFSANTGITPVP